MTEAVLRRLAEDKSYNTIREISYTGVRGFEGTKEATIELDGREVKIAVVHGLAMQDGCLTVFDPAKQAMISLRLWRADEDVSWVAVSHPAQAQEPDGAVWKVCTMQTQVPMSVSPRKTRQSVSCTIISLPEKNIVCCIGICRFNIKLKWVYLP